MNIKHEENGKKGRFFINEENRLLAEMTYVHAGPSKIIIDHTEVDEKYKGNGIGKILFDHMVETVRENSQKVMPLCPFTRAMFEKNTDKWDVLRHQSL